MNVKNISVENIHFKIYILIIFILGLLFNACDENPQQFKLGEEFIESQTQLNVIDTFSVKLSTVIYDTIVTSGTENILVGNYRDDVFGKIKSNSYFQVGIPDSFNVEANDVYDSLSLVITYNNYFYGDTTGDQKINVHQLAEEIELNDDFKITSQTIFNHSRRPIGSITYTPKPNSNIDTLAIKIHDAIGIDLFTKLKEESDIFDSDENFIDYFPGFVLAADDAYEGSIIGFKATAVSAKLVMYTSRANISTETICYEFPLENFVKQFNNITYDFTSTQLENLVEQKEELSSKESGGLSFLHGGIGLALRVDFPSFSEFLLRERGTIVEAELSIAPQHGSYSEFDLPSGLLMYESGKQNRHDKLVFDNQGAIASSRLIIDNQYNEETVYMFDVTKFLNDEIADSYVDPENGLLITLSASIMASKFHRFIADANHQKTKLKIYYLSY